MSKTYICTSCGETGNVFMIKDVYFVYPCKNHCNPEDAHPAVTEFKRDIEDEKHGIFRHDEEWCKENNYEFKG